jgi:hypothetical protein
MRTQVPSRLFTQRLLMILAMMLQTHQLRSAYLLIAMLRFQLMHQLVK